MTINTRSARLNNLIRKHTELGQKGCFLWNAGQIEEGDKCFDEAEQVWIEFNRLYHIQNY